MRMLVFLFLTAALCIASLVAPFFLPNDPSQVDLSKALMSPGGEYPFGTDQLGRCVFSRVVSGASATIFSAIVLTGIIFVFGTFVGVIGGYIGGSLDTLLMRIVDVLLAFPGLVLAIAVAGVLGGGLKNAVLALALISWTKYARLSRSLVLSIKEQNFIHASKLGGSSDLKIIFKHVIPNAMGPMVVIASMDIGVMMMQLAGLSFLGLGAQPPAPEWGSMLNEGRSMLQNAPWLTLYPGLSIFASIVIFNLFGDSLRDMFDPKKNYVN
ncbi:ABC transporter permease [Alkalibacter sp. M17DMB]|nr:ABC transporter permease [Alkalibacter mobilis]